MMRKMAKAPQIFISILLCCCWIVVSNPNEYVIYKDPNQPVSKRVTDLLKRMTLAEKIGQMTQIERSVASADVLKQYYIGSVLSGGGSVPSQKASPETWIDMVNGFQKGSLSTRLKIPMLYGIDAVHGHNNVYKATIFPHNFFIYHSHRFVEIQDGVVVMKVTVKIQRKNVLASAKHFVGDGGTTKGINENNTVASRRDLMRLHMPAYNDSIINGVGSVMISYSSWNGIKMHANGDLITGYLKNKLRFNGFVISDWQGLDRITSPPHANYTYSILAGVGAGIDMIMVPYNYTEFIDGLTSLVNNKFIPMSRIDDAVARILRVKFTMGLFEYPLADNSMIKYLGHKDHKDLAREAVRKSLVLLKNGKYAKHPLLPLPKKASKILVAGTHADNIGNQCGGWTIDWQGKSGNITSGTTILAAIKNTVDPKTVVFNENPNSTYVNSNKFDYAIVVVGEPPYAETFGDSLNLTLPQEGLNTIKTVCASVKCVVVLVTGRPVVIQPYLPKIDALVAAWLPGTEGQGVAEVLYGDYGFTGKLPRTWFRTVDQLPMNIGDQHYDPLFSFGFGLTTKPVKAN
ncbi:lysosomal beta glucosidase [Phtheirospermum japonicum]|uniref:Lysosomal beta glucosidase n=1 Tax=Phtheirospermum japonicum TaxID=374723 RepID=A0A830BZQ8_9LAMI|nr:lysosomal beta glucosidase [Phtheirospermum japonicum]